MRFGALLAPPLLALALVGSATGATRDARIAALQVALRSHGLYQGDVDGLNGPRTADALREFQGRARLAVDGVVGPQTRRALGPLGRPMVGRRTLRALMRGWDVAYLQFELAMHGFPSGTFDGHFGPHTDAALRRFQEWAGLVVDGQAGPATMRALRAPPPVSPLTFSPPVYVPYTDRFGPRGARMHTGVDFPGPVGTPVLAARSGQVTVAGWLEGYGNVVAIRHSESVSSLYAHLSAILVRPGQNLATGQPLGRVGSSGISSGPHLHFEVRIRGAAVDPVPSFG